MKINIVAVCDSMPCQNDGNCEALGSKYNCNCVPGYSGLNCEISLPEILTILN